MASSCLLERRREETSQRGVEINPAREAICGQRKWKEGLAKWTQNTHQVCSLSAGAQEVISRTRPEIVVLGLRRLEAGNSRREAAELETAETGP